MNNLSKLSKKLLFILTIITSMLLVINKTHAQLLPFPDYPFIYTKPSLSSLTRLPDNINTYEFEVVYTSEYEYSGISDIGDEYFLFTSHNILLEKGINRETNAYKVIRVLLYSWDNFTKITLQVTLEKNFVDENYSFNSNDDNYIRKFFEDDSVLYIKYKPNTSSSDYSYGYNDGYNSGELMGTQLGQLIGYEIGYEDGYARGLIEGYENGYNNGYDNGYDDGYDDSLEDESVKIIFKERYNEGYNKGLRDWFNNKFSNNFYIWIIPAIILVFGIGIFVSYRKERE